MEALSTETRYKKMSGFATTKGQMFEVKLSALLFLRGINSGLQFQLASNVAGAGALDDIVFRVKSEKNPEGWRTCFIQLKHKENSRVSCKMLTDPKGNFSLQKYCESYVEIKQVMSTENDCVLFDGTLEDCTVVIYSNAKANKDLGAGCRAAFGSIEAFLESESGNMFSFDKYRDTEADKAVFSCLEKFGKDGSDFLNQLRIFCDQPSESELNSVIKDELQKVKDKVIHLVDSERLCECFLENVSAWCEQSDFILHCGSDLLIRAWDKVIVETCSTRDKGNYRLDICFEEIALLPLRIPLKDKFSVIYIESSEESSLLTVAKVLLAIEGSYLFLDYHSVKMHSRSVAAEWKTGRYGTLVLVVNETDLTTSDDSILKELSSASVLTGRNIVIVCHAMALAAETLSSLPGIYLKDSFQFSQMTSESQNNFLDKSICFQGHLVSLKSFVNGHDDSDIFSASSFVEITKSCSKLQIGSEFTDPISYYIARTLTQTKTLAATVFEISELPVSFLVTFSSTDNVHTVLKQSDPSPANHHKVLKTLRKISEAPFRRNLSDSVVSHGDSVKLGSFTCGNVVLRRGEADEVTALRIRPRCDRSINGWMLFVDKTVAESDVRLLMEPNTRHCLSLENGRLEWIRSRSDSMDLIRNHVDELRVNELVTEIVTDVHDRLVLLCAEPGMGKTTLLARFAKKTKEALPEHFVVLIALNDHTRLFASNEHRDPFKFLVQAIGVESRLHRSMLDFALHKSGNVVILLDGFDEIAPTYVAECRLLLSNLLETKAKKIWITSRNSIKATLEDHLSTLARKLRKFTVADQRLFFRLYWETERQAALQAGKEIIDDEALDDFVDKLIDATSTAISEKEKDFMSIPLQTRMMAEIFEDHVVGSAVDCVLPEKLDLLSLLDRFVDKKLAIYVRDKLRVDVADTNYYVHVDVHRKAYVRSHMHAALVLILGDNDVGRLSSRSILRNSVEFFEKIGRGEDKTGIIDCVINGKPRFIHRVFAEYFVARWFAEHFEENASYLADNLFTPGFQVVRDVFDRLLAVGHPLHVAVLDENLDGVLTSLSSVFERDRGGRTPLHLAAALGTNDARHEAILQALIGRSVNKDVPFDGVKEVDALDAVFSATPLWYACVTRSFVAVDALLKLGADTTQLNNILGQDIGNKTIQFAIERDLDALLALCLDNELVKERTLLTEWLCMACKKGSVRVARLLIDRGANILKTSWREDPPLHLACKHGHVALVELLVEASKRNACQEGASWFTFFRNLFSRTGAACQRRKWRTRRVPWIDFLWNKFVPIAVRNPPFIDTLRGTTELQDHGIGETPLHVATQQNHLAVIRLLLRLGANPRCTMSRERTALHVAAVGGQSETVATLLESVGEDVRFALVNKADRFGNTAVHLAASSLSTLKILVSAGGSLTKTNSDYQTPLMLAAESNAMDVVEFIVHRFTATHETDAVKKMEHLNARGKDGATAISLAAVAGSKKIVSFLLREGAQFRGLRRSPLCAAIRRCDLGVVNTLLGAVGERYRARFMQEEEALALAITTGRRDLLDVLIAAGADVKIPNADGQTTLMTAARSGYVDIIAFLLQPFDNDAHAKHAFINTSSPTNPSALHHATESGHLNAVTLLVANGADVHSTFKDSTPLHAAAKHGRPDMIHALIAAACDVDAPDADGCTALHRAVEKGCVESVQVLVSAGARLALRNKEGETALLCAAMLGYNRIVEVLLDSFSEVREGVGRVEYINARDRKGRTALGDAKRWGRVEMVGHIEEALFSEGFVPSRWERCVLS